LRDLSGTILQGRLTIAMAVGVPVGLALLLGLRFCARSAQRWAASDDGRRRGLLGGFLGLVLLITLAAGIQEVELRHRETLDLLSLREAIVRRQALRSFARVTVLGPSSERSGQALVGSTMVPMATAALPAWGAPGGRLRFVLRSALPHVPEYDAARVEDLVGPTDGAQLVVLAGTGTRLSYSAQARLRLESIYPSRGGLLDAYATPVEPPSRPPPTRRR
jgi:hypothetical protein